MSDKAVLQSLSLLTQGEIDRAAACGVTTLEEAYEAIFSGTSNDFCFRIVENQDLARACSLTEKIREAYEAKHGRPPRQEKPPEEKVPDCPAILKVQSVLVRGMKFVPPEPVAQPASVPAEVKAPEALDAQEAPVPHVVEFKNVTKTYEGKTPFTAIKDVNFVVEDIPVIGEFIAVLGPSGCGKSTVLKLIAGLDPQFPPTTGEVHVLGKPVSGPGADRGMVFQEYTAFDNRTVFGNVAFGLECQGVPKGEIKDRVMHWIGKVGLNPVVDATKYPHQLSGGMRQRVAIARSMVLNPRILLMDEPFGALDPMTRLRMQDMLMDIWRAANTTVFFVTHAISEAVFLGDRIYMFSPSPGTITEEVRLKKEQEPALVAQARPDFVEMVREIQTKIAEMEKAAGVL